MLKKFFIQYLVVQSGFVIIVTIEDREYKNGWYYLCSLPSGAMGYRYEYELEIPINKEMERE